jgi:hypothetical protein
MTKLEMRRDTRYEVKLNCHISSPQRDFNELSGVTLNMSRSGMLAVFGDVESVDPAPAVGTPVRITVELPTAAGKPPRCVDCLGRIARVGEDPTPRKVAFSLQRYQFQSAGSGGGQDFIHSSFLDDLH